MTSYKDHTLAQYLEKLSSREPVPGGGSAAAISSALGASLISMAARYAIGKGKPADVEQSITEIITRSDEARARFIDLSGQDAQAYLNMVTTRKSGDKAAHAAAVADAARVVGDVIDLSKDCLALTPFLHEQGNPHLISDVKAAEALLTAGIRCASYMQEANT